MQNTLNLSEWLDRVSRASTRKQVFEILNEFRTLSWSDEECSQMAKHYIRLVSNMTEEDSSGGAAGAQEENEADGPVWYEKM